MKRSGTVLKIFSDKQSGTILDSNQTEFVFTIFNFSGRVMPTVGANVTFIKDVDYKTINVAIEVKRAS